jgi:serine/threonine-protein phosphatase Stp1
VIHFRITSAAETHPGRVRAHNEDAFLNRPDLGLWAVADGVGGHELGDVASSLIVGSLERIPAPDDAAQFIARVRAALGAVNTELRAVATGRGKGTVIGSTVVALMTFGDHYACLWAGDSRLYLLHGDAFAQLTRDHSQIREMIDAGLVSPEKAEELGISNIITRAVGSDGDLDLEKLSGPLVENDVFLLCSDGVTKMLTDPEIAGIMVKNGVFDIPKALIDAALERGGKDNITAVAVGIGPAPVADQSVDWASRPA